MSGGTVLFLGPADSPLLAWLRSRGGEVVQTEDRIDAAFVRAGGFQAVVSYGYRHILKADVLAAMPEVAVNLHISLLPWNRGADPNFWSFVDGTPKGVTIHCLADGVDTGDILAQKEVAFAPDEDTLASTYARLQAEIQDLFKESWPSILAGTCPRRPQAGGGSLHRMKDKETLAHLLADGWKTPVRTLESCSCRGEEVIPGRK
ncbi:formyl transferase [Magnetospirillum sp. ME-1]|uniref:formyltransferase family protein n=1 Tax=Magnetospirillum sp. ME-1 TaxID=1639348 RepID=UPI000A17D91B|nr:formyltransferase family protein [Magnetospirillum sp. ME-1]ARJ64641.1 formyl transferase [Magnetospirillum sp. ME-1]